ncbi:SAP domain-containing protein [Leucobacter musarum]|uniref:SAP domain-containing protein n=1 Tax=Leucobacter musarum TaxID=1930747 RepID=UPI0006A7945E|nr:SAP domain-containing protein [Leucobacter musarum]
MKVCQTINLLDDQFRLVTLSPGDEVPEWAVARVTNPDVIAGDDDFVEAVAAVAEAATTASEPVPPVLDTGDGYDALNKKDLQELLSKRELPTAGNKPELIERLREADKAAAAEEEVDLWSLSVDELKAYAEKHEIDVEGANTSEELAAVIQSAQSE